MTTTPEALAWRRRERAEACPSCRARPGQPCPGRNGAPCRLRLLLTIFGGTP